MWHKVPNNANNANSRLQGRTVYTVPMPVDLAERKRRAIRGELSEVALALLTDRKFESLTIDEIAAAAGVSRRTFFRYFTSKEDVVFAFLDQWAVRLAAPLAAAARTDQSRPPATGGGQCAGGTPWSRR